jgi:hypothetical protein
MNAHESSNRVEATAKILTSIPNRDLYRPLWIRFIIGIILFRVRIGAYQWLWSYNWMQ